MRDLLRCRSLRSSMENPSTWTPLVEALMSFDVEEAMLNQMIAKGHLPAEPYHDMLGVMRQAYVEHLEDARVGRCGYSLGRGMEMKLQELLGEHLTNNTP